MSPEKQTNTELWLVFFLPGSWFTYTSLLGQTMEFHQILSLSSRSEAWSGQNASQGRSGPLLSIAGEKKKLLPSEGIRTTVTPCYTGPVSNRIPPIVEKIISPIKELMIFSIHWQKSSNNRENCRSLEIRYGSV